MRHGLLLSEEILKQDADLLARAHEFLSKQTVSPSPAWYARLLEEYGAEIAAAIAAWFSAVENTLALTEWYNWAEPFLWQELEQMLARRLEPVLRNAARASARRQAVEQDEPIPIRLADAEIAFWAQEEARRQAQLIAQETRVAMLETLELLEIMGLPDEDRRRVILEGGIFALNRRFAGAALRPLQRDGVGALGAVIENGQRLLAVRRELIVTHNAVSSVTQGLIIAALFWQREGRLVTKTWVSQVDERRCEICGSLHFQEAPLRGFFVALDGSTHERPPAHVNCRCFVEIAIRPTDALDLVV